jgi:putative aminopeptidase FrvX
MQAESKAFLYKLLRTPSPTGFEQRVQKVVRKRMERYADDIQADLHGNLIAGCNLKAKRKVMLAGHCDQIGFMVTHIGQDGYVYVAALGGVDVGVLQGSVLTIHTQGGSIDGVVGRKPIHHQSPEERSKGAIDIKQIWIDIGSKTRKDAEKRVQIGDPVTYKLQPFALSKDLISSPGLDDKLGLFVAMETLRLCSTKKLKVGLYAVSTVQEEVGLRGAKTAAYSVDPEIGIAIDLCFANDNPGLEMGRNAPCSLGAGPAIFRGPNVNPEVERRLIHHAKKEKIPFQLMPYPALFGNDAREIQVSRGGVASASIGIPSRYMHTQVEVCHLSDVENAAKLLAAFVVGINDRTDFRPA